MKYTGETKRRHTLRILRASFPLSNKKNFKMVDDHLRVKEEAQARSRDHVESRCNVNTMEKKDNSDTDDTDDSESKVVSQTNVKKTNDPGSTSSDKEKTLESKPVARPVADQSQIMEKSKPGPNSIIQAHHHDALTATPSKTVAAGLSRPHLWLHPGRPQPLPHCGGPHGLPPRGRPHRQPRRTRHLQFPKGQGLRKDRNKENEKEKNIRFIPQ